MKLLLTSGGITNNSIAEALFDLVGKPPAETSIVFIPTAMNAGSGDKSWYINDLFNIKKTEVGFIDIVDISALPKNVWLSRMEKADVLFFSGGVTPHFVKCVRESGLDRVLPDLLKNKIYAGISAGSVATAKDLAVSSNKAGLEYKEAFGYDSIEGLSLVDFYFSGHLNNPKFPERTKEGYEQIASTLDRTLYALDDQSALKIVDDKIEVVSEGDWIKFDK